jgi:hypothetical protein
VYVLVVVPTTRCGRVVQISRLGAFLNGLYLSTFCVNYLKAEIPKLLWPLRFTLYVAIVMTVTNGVHKSVLSALPLVQKLSKDHDLVLKTFRLLIADLCQQFSGGHPGYVKYQVSIVSFAIRRLIVI